ncbi:MAG: peptide deformylase [Deltaproteobacteria bacterium]|nr:peptide deformylase [Deltaproteobacteria bacterium]MBW2444613.1 peptide deformylase [Deltaproteobacteria bacterium]
MAILKVARLGHPVLREKCRDLTPEEIVSEPVRQLVADMRATMSEYAGVGLAAPQVHEPVRLALVEFEEGDDRYRVDADQALLVLFNARVDVLDAEPAGFWEGCLSVPGLRGFVERPSKIRVEYLDENAEPCELLAEGFLSTVCQHELDHLDGVLYVDKIADPERFAFVEEYERFHQPAPDDA